MALTGVMKLGVGACLEAMGHWEYAYEAYTMS